MKTLDTIGYIIFKNLINIYHAIKMVSTQIINEKLIIIVDLKFYKNVKTEFS